MTHSLGLSEKVKCAGCSSGSARPYSSSTLTYLPAVRISAYARQQDAHHASARAHALSCKDSSLNSKIA